MALLFSPTLEQRDYLTNHKLIDILAEPQWNEFRGSKTIQLIIRDLKPNDHALELEILSEKNNSKEINIT